jgi:hypothetical protein
VSQSPSDQDKRYGIAGRAAAEAVLEHGRDGARLRSASDAFLLSRIARAVVDALDQAAHDETEVDR